MSDNEASNEAMCRECGQSFDSNMEHRGKDSPAAMGEITKHAFAPASTCATIIERDTGGSIVSEPCGRSLPCSMRHDAPASTLVAELRQWEGEHRHCEPMPGQACRCGDGYVEEMTTEAAGRIEADAKRIAELEAEAKADDWFRDRIVAIFKPLNDQWRAEVTDSSRDLTALGYEELVKWTAERAERSELRVKELEAELAKFTRAAIRED